MALGAACLRGKPAAGGASKNGDSVQVFGDGVGNPTVAGEVWVPLPNALPERQRPPRQGGDVFPLSRLKFRSTDGFHLLTSSSTRSAS